MTNFQVLQPSVGVGLRSQYFEYFLADIPKIPIGWLEVHPENYLDHYPNREKLKKISEKFPISFHCVSLSLGASELPAIDHLQRLKDLMQEISPFIISEHLSWNTLDGFGYNDLYPMPLTDESLKQMAQNINFIQDFFDRQIYVENPSTYLTFQNDMYPEYEFLNQLSKATGCGVLLDLNNLYVQSVNHGWNTAEYMENLNWESVKEFHLAGHIRALEGDFLIDTHNRPVCHDVWDLYKNAARYQPNALTLIEWDEDLPDIHILLDQAVKAEKYRELAYA
ncbi:MAG: DUF692 domain-containing protein [Candidatus Paracaedibacteraceae bacterium]|nr:DUF692 domain-containing protein [Candidatus Paracaedibacteraceae bacterium]